MESRKCEVCNVEFTPRNGYHKTKRCDEHRENRKEKKFEDLKKDLSRKLWLIDERGRKCEVCSITEWMGQQTPITLDHIDGNPGNNDKSNLRLLCPNCHAQTDTFCAKNSRKQHSKSERAAALAKYPRYRDLKLALSSTG